MEWGNFQGRLRKENFYITIAPTNCRVALKALNQWFKRWASNNTFRLFLKLRNLAHQHQGELPFYYALGQSLSDNHAHCRGVCYINLSIQFLYQLYTSKTKFLVQRLFPVQNVSVSVHKNPLTDSWLQEAIWQFCSWPSFYSGTSLRLL